MEPSFWVRDVPVFGDVILAPMAGYADVPYRALCRALGSAMSYSEFVPVEMLQGKPNSAWRCFDRFPAEKPMVFQIFGNDPHKILSAAQRIEALKPDIIDVNMGCSTKKVSGRGAGVGMMRRPDLVAETFRLLTSHLHVPVSAKIRLGWDDSRNYLEIGRILEGNGAALIAIHARTKEQKYSGRAEWEAIGQLKQMVSVPVIGCGDVQTPTDIERIKHETGCDGVMIGRAAIGNPWIFARRQRDKLPLTAILEVVRHHLTAMIDYYGERHGVMLFRKHLHRYLAGIEGMEPLLRPMLIASDQDQLGQLLAAADEALGTHLGAPVTQSAGEAEATLACAC
jgi:nifR3 family TIM-barrel protein